MAAGQHHLGAFNNRFLGLTPALQKQAFIRFQSHSWLTTSILQYSLKFVRLNSITQLIEGVLGNLVSLKFLLFQSIQEAELIILT